MKQKHCSFHMPLILKNNSNRCSNDNYISLMKSNANPSTNLKKNKNSRSIIHNLDALDPKKVIINQTKTMMSFYQQSRISKLQTSNFRVCLENNKLNQIQNYQRKKKKLIKLQYNDQDKKQNKKEHRISIDIGQKQNLQAIEHCNINTDQFMQKCRDSYDKQPIHYEVDMQPITNICYDSQFPFRRQGDVIRFLQNKIFMMGGCIRRKLIFPKAQQKYKELLLHYYQNQKWNQQEIPFLKMPKFNNLVGHTVQTINKNTLAFTFGMSGDSVQTLFEYNPTIITFNIDKKQFSQINCNIKLRNHASTSYQNYLLVHGGINHQHIYQKQLYIVYFMDSESIPRLVSISTGQALANHKMVTTLGMDISARISLKQNDGIFIFGGQNCDGKLNNDFKVLRMAPSSIDNQRRVAKKFQKVFSKGKKPCARINHTMNLIPNKNKIVIIGGTDQQGNYLSDIWIFDMIFSQWLQYKSNPDIRDIFGGIAKHSSTVNGTKLYIFGGQHQKQCGNENFWEMQFDNSKKIKDQRRKKTTEYNGKSTSFWSLSTSKNVLGAEIDILNDYH